MGSGRRYVAEGTLAVQVALRHRRKTNKLVGRNKSYLIYQSFKDLTRQMQSGKTDGLEDFVNRLSGFYEKRKKQPAFPVSKGELALFALHKNHPEYARAMEIRYMLISINQAFIENVATSILRVSER